MANKNEVWRKDRDHLIHPWTHFDSFKEEGSLVIERAEGAQLWDTAGKSYFDAVGGLWCSNIGLGRDEMAQAIADQVRKMAFANPFVDMTSIPAANLAAKLGELAPGDLNRVFFTTGGSTAIDSAFRLVHFYQNCRGKHCKKHIIARVDSYHGSTFAAMSITGKSGDRIDEFDYLSETIHHIASPNYYRAQDGMTESQFCDVLINELESKIADLGADQVAAFFAEPVLGSGGVIVPPADYNRRVWEVCQQNDVLFVADEVVTGFGRLGHWFSSQAVFGVTPDIITCAKGLTSGYQPLGAVIVSEKIWRSISRGAADRYFANGFTYSGHPVACAAALKNIEIIERERLCANVRDHADYFREKLQTLRRLPIVGDVRGIGFMWCVEFVADQKTKACFPETLNIGKRISNWSEKYGLIVRPIGHLNVMSPPLTITPADIDLIVERLEQAIISTIEELNLPRQVGRE